MCILGALAPEVDVERGLTCESERYARIRRSQRNREARRRSSQVIEHYVGLVVRIEADDDEIAAVADEERLVAVEIRECSTHARRRLQRIHQHAHDVASAIIEGRWNAGGDKHDGVREWRRESLRELVVDERGLAIVDACRHAQHRLEMPRSRQQDHAGERPGKRHCCTPDLARVHTSAIS